MYMYGWYGDPPPWHMICTAPIRIMALSLPCPIKGWILQPAPSPIHIHYKYTYNTENCKYKYKKNKYRPMLLPEIWTVQTAQEKKRHEMSRVYG